MANAGVLCWVRGVPYTVPSPPTPGGPVHGSNSTYTRWSLTPFSLHLHPVVPHTVLSPPTPRGPCYLFGLIPYTFVLSTLIAMGSLLLLQHTRHAPASGPLHSSPSTWNTLPHPLHGSRPHFPGAFAEISPLQGLSLTPALVRFAPHGH